MTEYRWRTLETSSYVKYVDANTGSDYFGDGTQLSPFQTLRRAYDYSNVWNTKPAKIICRGRFSEQMLDGNHLCLIVGDYPGAAVFDGAGVYTLYGFTHNNLHIVNIVGSDKTDSWEWETYAGSNLRSALFAGVGRAGNAAGVGNADLVHGVSGSSNLIHNSVAYFGGISDNSGSNNVWSKIKTDPLGIYKIGLLLLNHSTVYDLDISKVSQTGLYSQSILYSLFGKVDFYLNYTLYNKTFNYCVFANDCRFFCFDSANTNNPILINLIKTEDTSLIDSHSAIQEPNGIYEYRHVNVYIEEGQNISNAMMILLSSSDFSYLTTLRVTFNNCIFSNLTSELIFNNPEKLDFTLRYDCNAVYDGLYPKSNYYGALPPAINIPFYHTDGGSELYGSDGKIECWDDRTTSGFLDIDSNDNLIIDLSNFELNDQGTIESKIIKIDPNEYVINGIYGFFTDKFRDLQCGVSDRENLSDLIITVNTDDPVELQHSKKYLVKEGQVIYKTISAEGSETEYLISSGETIQTGEEITLEGLYPYSISMFDQTEAIVLEILNPNVIPVVYARALKYISKRNLIKQTDLLINNKLYYNFGLDSITYNDRIINSGESFYCTGDEHYFVANDENYQIALMFNESELSQFDWVPMQQFGLAFVMLDPNGIIDYNGEPGSSGNNYCYKTAFTTLAVNKKFLDRSYILLKYIVKKY